MAKLNGKKWLLFSVIILTALVVWAAPHLDSLEVNGLMTVNSTASPALHHLAEDGFGISRFESRNTGDEYFMQFYKSRDGNANLLPSDIVAQIQFNARHNNTNNATAAIKSTYRGNGTTTSGDISFFTGNSSNPVERGKFASIGTFDLAGITKTARDALTGMATGAMIFNTTHSRFEFYDGAAWLGTQPTTTAWADCSAPITITAVTANPTKADTVILDQCSFRRVGDTMEINYLYRHTNNTGALAGTGIYIWDIPEGKTADTAKIAVTSNGDGTVVGSALVLFGTSQCTGSVVIREGDSDGLMIIAGDHALSPQPVSSTQGEITGSAVEYSFSARIPITGWTTFGDPD